MTLRQPKDISECVYFTNRGIGKGRARAWVFRELCTKCGKGLMDKPKDPKTGKIIIRANEYVCPECNHTIEKKEYEDSLIANIEYICPHCGNIGGIQVPFKRKKVQIFYEVEQKKVTLDSLRFSCQKCGKNIDITKKMK